MRSELDTASFGVAGSRHPAAEAACRFTTASCCPDVDHADSVQPIRLSRANRRQLPCFELAVSDPNQNRPNVQYLLSQRPIAVLSLIPRPAVLFAAGAISGAIGKTLTAPLDRVKLLLQTSGGLQKGAVKQAVQKGGVWQALVAIGRTEGIKGYWKGNLPQVGPCVLWPYRPGFLGNNDQTAQMRKRFCKAVTAMTKHACLGCIPFTPSWLHVSMLTKPFTTGGQHSSIILFVHCVASICWSCQLL